MEGWQRGLMHRTANPGPVRVRGFESPPLHVLLASGVVQPPDANRFFSCLTQVWGNPTHNMHQRYPNLHHAFSTNSWLVSTP